jgi:hypothetical protein
METPTIIWNEPVFRWIFQIKEDRFILVEMYKRSVFLARHVTRTLILRFRLRNVSDIRRYTMPITRLSAMCAGLLWIKLKTGSTLGCFLYVQLLHDDCFCLKIQNYIDKIVPNKWNVD